MTNCKGQQELFQGVKGRKVEVNFQGGHVSSDGGVLLLSKADKLIRLTERVAKFISDNRRKKSCDHRVLEMLRQRVYAICQGYEDLNDHDSLRNDMAFQTAVEVLDPLASSPTLCRFENTMTGEVAWRINELFIDLFIESHRFAPEELILDFDATDDPVHGNQEGRFFHGYYDQYCFLPLYVFCEDQLMVAMLRPSNIDPARHSGAILKLIVRKLRKAWPQVQIIMRGDSGFCRHRMMGWCERNNVGYIFGIAKNPRLEAISSRVMRKAEKKHRCTGEKVKLYKTVWYAADTWSVKRPVIVKAEHGSKGRNNRYIVTNLQGDCRWLYESMYCARGEMENRIKEKQLDLFADRTSCHKWWPNQFRVLLSGMAYALMNVIRTRALYRTELQSAQCGTIRLKLLKIGAVIMRNTRRIRFMLSSHFPLKEIFMLAACRLNTC